MSMSINVTVDFSDKYKKIVGAAYDKIADEVLTRTIVEADSICQREAPVDTGTLRRSIGTSHPNMGTVCLTAGVKYWVHVQYGTSAHTITPKNKSFLAWKGKDKKLTFARKVNHPGTKANPFVTRTVKKIKGKRLLETNFHEILKMKGII